MSKQGQRLLKAAERFRKNAEKELAKVRKLLEKGEKLDAQDELAARLVERLKQKELQANGECVWVDQFLTQARAELDVRKAARAAEARSDKPKSKRN